MYDNEPYGPDHPQARMMDARGGYRLHRVLDGMGNPVPFEAEKLTVPVERNAKTPK